MFYTHTWVIGKMRILCLFVIATYFPKGPSATNVRQTKMTLLAEVSMVHGELWKTASMRCSASPTANKIKLVQWATVSDGELVYVDSTEKTNAHKPFGGFKNRNVTGQFDATNSSHVLVITNPIPTDAREYTCIILSQANEQAQGYVHLNLVAPPDDPPAIRYFQGKRINWTDCCAPQAMVIPIGQKHVSLVCSVGLSNPRPKVSWGVTRYTTQREGVGNITSIDTVQLVSIERIIDVNISHEHDWNLKIKCEVHVPDPRTGQLFAHELCIAFTPEIEQDGYKNARLIVVLVVIMLGVVIIGALFSVQEDSIILKPAHLSLAYCTLLFRVLADLLAIRIHLRQKSHIEPAFPLKEGFFMRRFFFFIGVLVGPGMLYLCMALSNHTEQIKDKLSPRFIVPYKSVAMCLVMHVFGDIIMVIIFVLYNLMAAKGILMHDIPVLESPRGITITFYLFLALCFSIHVYILAVMFFTREQRFKGKHIAKKAPWSPFVPCISMEPKPERVKRNSRKRKDRATVYRSTAKGKNHVEPCHLLHS